MRRSFNNKRLKSLDMVAITISESKKKSTSEIMIFVNTICFQTNQKYSLIKANCYVMEGILDLAWKFIFEKKYKEADASLEELFLSNPHSSALNFAKFVISLFEGEESYSYLQQAIENRTSFEQDNDYLLYLKLFQQLSSDYDVIPLLELLRCPKLVAFNQCSYNGKYLELLASLEDFSLPTVKQALANCQKMMPRSFSLEIASFLLKKIEREEKTRKENAKLQDKFLEKERCQNLVEDIKEKNMVRAKEDLIRILSFREYEQKDNYVYYLLLELLEMIESIQIDPTFELIPVSYTYKNESDAFYTFMEAISLGDFLKAKEVGETCKSKVLDSSQPIMKVSVYLSLLDCFFEKLEERQKELETIYQIIQGNIQRGHYLHALELYQIHEESLKYYQRELLLDLFEAGIAIEKKMPPLPDTEVLESFDPSMEELKEAPIEVQNQDAVIEEEITSQLEEIGHEKTSLEKEEEEVESIQEETVEEKNDGVKEDPLEETIALEEPLEEEQLDEQLSVPKQIKENTNQKPLEKEEIFYPAQPLLEHIYPQHPYFLNFLRCFQVLKLDEARNWLSQYDQLLRMNQLEKRLDQFYYTLEITQLEMMESKEIYQEKERMYELAYNAMRHYDYEEALNDLDNYQKLDTTHNNKGLILQGYIYNEIGNSQKALEKWLEANAIAPNPDTYYFLGESYYKKKRWSDAVFCYLIYNEFYPKERISVYLNLAECYQKMKKLKKVIKYLRLADEINREQSLNFSLTGRILEAEYVYQMAMEKLQFLKSNNKDS